MSETKSKKHNPFEALTVKEFQYFLINKFFFTAGVQMLNVIVAFESGVTARAFGLKPSIVIGGILTILTVIGISRLSPKLRKLNLDDL